VKDQANLLALKRLMAACHTLEALNYSYTEGTDAWRPPLGKKPDFDRMPFQDELSEYLVKWGQRLVTDTDFDRMTHALDQWHQFRRLVLTATWTSETK
jgi:hypothetical protein